LFRLERSIREAFGLPFVVVICLGVVLLLVLAFPP